MTRRRAPAAAPKTKAARAEVRADNVTIDPMAPYLGSPGSSALYNLETGMGIAGRDNGVAYRWRDPRRLSETEIKAITVDGIGRRGVSLCGWEATRQWGKVQAPRSKLPADALAKVIGWLEQKAEHLHLRSRISDLERERERWGDAALVSAIGPVAAWCNPIDPHADPEALKVRSLRVLRGHGLDYRPTALHTPESPEWGEASEITIATMALAANPEDEHLWGSMNLRGSSQVRVHASRFHRLRTVDGRSDLDGVSQRLAELLAAARGAARMSSRPAIPFIRSKNIGSQIRANKQRAKDHYGSAHAEADEGAPLLLDLAAGEEVGYEGPPGGLSVIEPITGLGFMLAAAWGRPMTLLFGMSPGGLGSNGDSERDNWHNTVRKVQAELEPAVLEVYRALTQELAATLRSLAAADLTVGQDAVAAERLKIADAVATLDLAFTWAPLRVLDAVEEADWRLKTAQWQTAYLDKNVIRADEIRASVFGSADFSADVTIVNSANDNEVQKSIPVGTAQAALSTLIAAAAGQISSDTAKAMLTALDPGFTTVAATLTAGLPAKNPTPLPEVPGTPAPVADASKDLEAMWTEPQIRRALQVGRTTVARWVTEGRLKPFDAGNGRRRYRKSEVEALYRGDPVAQEEGAEEAERLDALGDAA